MSKELKITPHDIEVLKNQSHETLARWACELNSWGWPQELLPEESQKDWEKGRRTALMEYIKSMVGDKAVSRHWNVVRGKRMTEEYFEEWWSDKQTMTEEEHFQKHYQNRSLDIK